MSRIQPCLLVACVILLSAGCQSRCNNPYGGWFAGNSTLAPPPTYSLNIPSSVASNQPYYTPNQAAPTNRTLNTNQSAPTPASQAGWRATDTNLSNGSGGQGQPSSVLSPQTKFVETQARPGGQVNLNGQPQRFAALPGSGVSFTNSQNYQTTPFDERQDATRLAVTDASAVRAPARNFPTGNVALLQPTYRNPANYSVPAQQTYVAQNGYYAQPGYSGQVMMYNGQAPGYQGQAVLVNPNMNSQNVYAQSTASTPEQVGWHAREMNSDRFR